VALAERVGIWKVSLRLPDDVKAVVKRAAAAEGRSMNSWVVRALQRQVQQDLAELEITGRLQR
jgi:predicted HicB family RNase H-like nuclease